MWYLISPFPSCTDSWREPQRHEYIIVLQISVLFYSICRYWLWLSVKVFLYLVIISNKECIIRSSFMQILKVDFSCNLIILKQYKYHGLTNDRSDVMHALNIIYSSDKNIKCDLNLWITQWILKNLKRNICT